MKRFSLSTRLHDEITQKTVMSILATVRTWNITHICCSQVFHIYLLRLPYTVLTRMWAGLPRGIPTMSLQFILAVVRSHLKFYRHHNLPPTHPISRTLGTFAVIFIVTETDHSFKGICSLLLIFGSQFLQHLLWIAERCVLTIQTLVVTRCTTCFNSQ